MIALASSENVSHCDRSPGVKDSHAFFGIVGIAAEGAKIFEMIFFIVCVITGELSGVDVTIVISMLSPGGLVDMHEFLDQGLSVLNDSGFVRRVHEE